MQDYVTMLGIVPVYRVHVRGYSVDCSSPKAALALIAQLESQDDARRAPSTESPGDTGLQVLRLLSTHPGEWVRVKTIVQELGLESGRALGAVQRLVEARLKPHGIPPEAVIEKRRRGKFRFWRGGPQLQRAIEAGDDVRSTDAPASGSTSQKPPDGLGRSPLHGGTK